MRKPFVGNYPITQNFGANPDVYGPGGHKGIDYGLPSNTPVIAMERGTVTKMPTQANGFGTYLTLKFGTDYTAYYGHLSRVTKTGVVAEGDVIGYSDNTGWSTGPHLHLEIYRNRTLINPNDLLNPAPAPTLRRLRVIVHHADIYEAPSASSKPLQTVYQDEILWSWKKITGATAGSPPSNLWFRVRNGWISASQVR